jgi:predicted ATPase
MRIRDLHIENFRAIKQLSLDELEDMVVIAGANGCGKTQVYHAVRLLKSTYGGYQPNEYQQWWGEFNIRLDRPGKDIRRIFGNPDRPLRIRATIELSSSELEFLRSSAQDIVRGRIWEEIAPGVQRAHFGGGPTVAQLQRTYGPEVERRTAAETQVVIEALQRPQLTAELTVQPGGVDYQVASNSALELLFSTYEPNKLGVFDYHGAQRNYNREQLGGINLNIESSEQKLRQHALYNWQSKYSNVKSELAAGYVRDLIATQAGAASARTTSLLETLQELFATFFPGKQFLGPVPGPDGTIDFPVKLDSGAEHDIDDLSSGEKEVLFGYLRLRNNAPRNSVVLIDEPELHLNPALLSGLLQFYHRHIGRDLGNQLWLMTHSDVLLREAVGQPEFSVYHMQSPETCDESTNQLQAIEVQEQLDRAIVDLVGDLATYRPGAKVVFFEGGGDADFDVRMTTQLFPEFRKAVNFISAGNRARVERLHDLLRKASEAGSLAARFFSIVDQDSGPVERAADSYQWDRYHIENYLLEPEYILAVMRDLNLISEGLETESDIQEQLKQCAEATLDSLVRHELEQGANSLLLSAIRTRTSRDISEIAPALREAVEASLERISEALNGELTVEKLSSREMKTRNRFSQNLQSDEWLSSFRGRDVLRRFVELHVQRVKYEVFRDLIFGKMRDASFQPSGMRQVIQKILNS